MELIKVNESGMEMGIRFEDGFPFAASYKNITAYKDAEVLSHWHAEWEFILVVKGEMDYIGEDCERILTEGQGILINGNVLHSYRKRGTKDCRYMVMCFHPAMLGLYNEDRIYKKYVYPYFMGERMFLTIGLSDQITWEQTLMELLAEAEQTWAKKQDGYEMDIQIALFRCCRLLYEYDFKKRPIQPARETKSDRAYQAVKYIRDHIAEKIYLSDIARSCSVSKSECCRIFKKQVGQSPMDYVLKYRIERSLSLLEKSGLSVLEVAEAVGFESQSYYTKVFRNMMKCTPKEYRKRETEG